MIKINCKNIIKFVIKIIAVYIVFNILALLIANTLIFVPPKPSTYKNSKNIIHIPVKNNNSIAAIYLPNKKAKYTIIYSHGNGDDLGVIYPFLKELQEHGFAVLGYDYEGYGLSTGTPSENKSYQDALAAYNYVNKNLKTPPSRIISMGHSLGSALAIYLSLKKQTAGLIIMSPFVTAFRVMTHVPIFLGDKYNNLKRIKQIHVPVLIMHGTKDKIISFWNGQKLYKYANKPKEFVAIKGAGHNNIPQVSGNNFWIILQNFIQNKIKKSAI